MNLEFILKKYEETLESISNKTIVAYLNNNLFKEKIDSLNSLRNTYYKTHLDLPDVIKHKLIISNTEDTERIKIIKKIQLETNFYNTFRNTIRILLGRPEYSDLRQEILNIIKSIP